MKDVLFMMIVAYSENGRDWMNYKVHDKNPYTYHHIVKKEDKGKETIENGAILTKQAHSYLHLIEKYDILIYQSINNILKEINEQKHQPTKKQLDRIELLLTKFELEYGIKIIKGNKEKKKKVNITNIRRKIQEGEILKFR